jgi:hypothetical protein
MQLYRKACTRQEFVNFKPLIIRGMRLNFLIIPFLFYNSYCCLAQVSNPEMNLLTKLDSITKSSSVSRHFAGLYLETTVEAVIYFQQKDERQRQFIHRLEESFARYFFDAAEAFKKGEKPAPAWQAYYADTTLTPLQYELLGINAHINGDIWQALVAEFRPEEISQNKTAFLAFQKGLNAVYQRFYRRATTLHIKTKMLHTLSFGLDQLYGKLMLNRWRKRQIKLADWYFKNPDLFRKKNVNLQKKMHALNRLILHHL